MEGLFFESSLTTPFMFLASNEMSLKGSTPVAGLDYRPFDFERGLRHMQMFGVRYYVSYSAEAAEKADLTSGLTKVGESAPFGVYELDDVALVEPLTVVPSVYEAPEDSVASADDGNPHDFDAFALDWYGDPESLDHVVTLDGPDSWDRVTFLEELVDRPTEVVDAVVTDVVSNNETVSFRTTAIGVPHLVKVSYFPNWTVEGAEGPFRATPSLMVVIPTQEQVTLTFRNTLAENTGNVLTLLGLAGFFVLLTRRRSDDPSGNDLSAQPSGVSERPRPEVVSAALVE
jgi:hypothetical protein